MPSVREARQILSRQRALPDWRGRHGSRFSGLGWFHVKPMARPPPGVFHKTLQTELRTESVTSSCRMALMTDGLSFLEGDPSCAVAREDEPDAAAMWILEVGRRVRRVRRDGRRCAEMEECGE